MLRRHSLVWLADPDDPPDRLEFADAWRQAGNPFVVCRTRPGEELSLGFCLPASHGGTPLRIGMPCSFSQVVHCSRPPGLAEAAGLDVLSKSNRDLFQTAPEGMEVRVIGSAMWELLTGVRYLRKNSDLDLLIDLKHPGLADIAVNFLAQLAVACPLRLDAELSFPNLGEIHWKEWTSQSRTVLVKSMAEARLIERSEIDVICRNP